MGRHFTKSLAALTLITFAVGCSSSSDEEASVAAPKKLYIATGICYSGEGFTPPTIGTVGKTLSRLNLSSLNYEMVHDYGDLSLETSGSYPAGIVDAGDGTLFTAVENATATCSRRIDRITKDYYGAFEEFYKNSTVLTTALKGIALGTDGGVLIGRTTLVDRLDSTPTRKTVSATVAWGEGFAGACATNNTSITSITSLPLFTDASYGKFIYTHDAAGQKDIGIIGMNGAGAAADCLANAPGGATLTNAATANNGFSAQLSATATPTAVAYAAPATGSTIGKLFVAYSSSDPNVTTAAGLSNALVVYDVEETSATAASITNGTVLYHDHQYFFGVSALAYDATTSTLYAASSNSFAVAPSGYNIEQFTIDLTTPGATRVTRSNGESFQSANSFNNCVTSMIVAD